MIQIVETVPSKLSGITAFHVYSKYDPGIIEAIKALAGPCIWLKKEGCWEVPANYLSKLLDSLVFFDQIDLQLLQPKITEVSDSQFYPLTENEIISFRVKPFKHQIEGINFLLKQRKSLLLDSMGLGKTNEMIWYAETLKSRGLIDHCLIICGVNSVKLNFAKESKKFSRETCRVLGQKISKKGKISYSSVTERAKELQNPISEFFVVTNIETLRSDAVISAISKSKNSFGLICVDEIHKAANTSSTQGHNLRKLLAPFKVAATGTLITNNPISAYGPLSWIERDHATLTNYKAQYCNFGGFGDKQIVGYKNLDLLQDELDQCSLRRTFDMVKEDMPTKLIEFELVEMSDEHKAFYEAIKAGVKEEADKIELKANNLLALTTRLRQATAAPSVLTSQPILSSKVERCIEIIEELIGQGEKVVVLSTFKEPVYQLAELLKQYSPLVNTGDVDDAKVSDNVDLFQTDPNVKLFLGTHSKVGTGLSLPVAHYMIMLDTPWTYSQFSQSADRIYRITSDQNVYIRVLACAETIDERVIEIIENKKELSDYLVDGVDNTKFTDELRDILLKL